MNSSPSILDKYSFSNMGWYHYKTKKRRFKWSIQFRQIQKSVANQRLYHFGGFDTMTNPSGFSVSCDKKRIVTYDTIGQLQVLYVPRSELERDTIFARGIVSATFLADDSLVLFHSSGTLSFLQKKLQSKITEIEVIGAKIFDTKYNGDNLFAISSHDKLILYDISTSKIIQNYGIVNSNNNLMEFGFIPETSIIWYSKNKSKN